MLKIKVGNASIKTITARQGPNAGKEMQIPEVHCHAFLPNEEYPVKFIYALEKGQQPPPAGEYMLHASSFTIGKYGELTLKRSLTLVAIPPKP